MIVVGGFRMGVEQIAYRMHTRHLGGEGFLEFSLHLTYASI